MEGKEGEMRRRGLRERELARQSIHDITTLVARPLGLDTKGKGKVNKKAACWLAISP
jgi:hypothetical protein